MTIFKALSAEDRVSTKALLHQAIPITGTVLVGLMELFQTKQIFKTLHKMFQSVAIIIPQFYPPNPHF